MADIQISINQNGETDWATAFNDLVWAPDDVQTLVLVSLFTKQGTWLGDTYSPYKLGSQLHLLQNSAISNKQQLLLTAQQYASDSLRWLVADGRISSYSVTTSLLSSSALQINVNIVELPSSTVPLILSYTIPV
jgi:phage gp46-like protein